MFIPTTTALMAIAIPMPVILAAIVIALLLIFFVASYVKAPPNKAYIISGARKRKKILIGRAGLAAGWKLPNELGHCNKRLQGQSRKCRRTDTW